MATVESRIIGVGAIKKKTNSDFHTDKANVPKLAEQFDWEYYKTKDDKNTYKKIKQLKEMILTHNATTLIEIDGGVNAENAKKLTDAGADVLVAGSFIFSSKNQLQTISDLKNKIA